MTIKKFRTVEEMKAGGTWRTSGDPELLRAMAAVFEFGVRTARVRFVPGVHKHRSVEAMNDERQLVLGERAGRT